jgi:ATP-dependent RNA helicase DDX56/DBP9
MLPGLGSLPSYEHLFMALYAHICRVCGGNEAQKNLYFEILGCKYQSFKQESTRRMVISSFESLGLDQRLVQALSAQGFTEPTPIQAHALPLAVNDKKDIVARARTGSGKTATFLVPIIQGILAKDVPRESPLALLLVPSKELADQVVKMATQLTMYCDRQVPVVNLAQAASDKVQASLLAAVPAVVVATPARALAHIKTGTLDAGGMEYFVIDEADLIVSYGYESDVRELAELLPKTMQTFLMSATLSEETDGMKAQFCRNVAVVKLEDTASSEQLLQYYVKCSEQDKFLLVYVILKLQLIKGKTLLFVNDIDRCYRLKLFLEQFGLRSCVLNSELPLTSRLHILDQFNKGVYNLLIATDESQEADQVTDEQQQDKNTDKKDNDYGIHRGMDFINVSCVLNFDLPRSSKSYTHRIGRTARAHNTGMALSFVVPSALWGKHNTTSLVSAKRDEKVLARIVKSQANQDNELKPYAFDMKQVDAFRYRMEDALRAVTKIAIREARVKEIRQELLTSDKLKRHFEENPQDLQTLRHDKELHPTRVQSHLKHVPSYLLPKTGRKEDVVDVPFKKDNHRVHKKGFKGKSKRKADPLKSFKRR